MKKLFLLLSLSFIFFSCDKIPRREQTIIRVISVNDTPYVEGSDVEVEYGSEAEIVFEFISDTELDYAYIKLDDRFSNEMIESSDDENITNHPQPGDKEGTFTYTVRTLEQFDEPIGNPVVDLKILRTVIMNQLGTVKEFNISILPL